MRDFLPINMVGSHHWSAAIDAYVDALSEHPHSAYLRSGLADARIKLGELENAEHDLKTAIKDEPKYIISYQTMRRLYAIKGDIENELNILGELLEMLPDASSKLERGELKGDFEAAERIYIEDANHSFRTAKLFAQFTLAGFYERRGRFQHACDQLDVILSDTKHIFVDRFGGSSKPSHRLEQIGFGRFLRGRPQLSRKIYVRVSW